MYRFLFLYFAFSFRHDCCSYSHDRYEIYQNYLKSVCDVYKHFGETKLNISLFSFSYNIILIYFEVSNFKFIKETREKWKINTEIYDIINDLVFFLNILVQFNYWVYFGGACSIVNKCTWKQVECDIRIFTKIILGRMFINFGVNFFVNVHDYVDYKKMINKVGVIVSIGYNLFHNVSIYPSVKLKLTYKDIS